MSDPAKLSVEEEKVIEDLRTRMKKELPPKLYDDSVMFYRFLKARDFDIEKAEVMLRKHILWRKVFQVDSILESLKPMEVFRKCIAPQFIGFDKDGDVIAYVPSGNIDWKDVPKCMKMRDIEKHFIYYMEQNLALLKKENEKSGRNCYQGILIINLEELSFINAANKATAEIMIQTSHLLQDNYPDTMKAAFVINAPSYYVFMFSILRRVMSNAMVQKIHVFGRSGWRKALLKTIDASVLPAFLGGRRTDPDGNPLCKTFIYHGGKLPTKYHLTSEDRWFKYNTLVKKTIVSPLTRSIISVKIKECGCWIRWQFECKYKDIGFGLFYEDNGTEIEVIPIQRFTTFNGTETGSYKTESAGKYILVFDNSYSWMSSKEIHYAIKIISPVK